MVPFFRTLLVAACAATAFFAQPLRAKEASHDATRAMFVLQLSNYVTWPATAFSSPTAPIVVAVLGNPALTAELTTLARSQSVGGRSFEIRAAADAAGCAGAHLVFVSEAAQSRGLTASPAALRVSEEADKLADTDIAIRMISGRVAFAVNRKDVNRRGLEISSKLMRLASDFE
jgi:hypothetical protein